MIVSASALAHSISSAATRLRTTLPKHYLAELDTARKIVAASAELDGHTASFHAAALTALRDNRDPGADPNVQRFAALVGLADSGIRVAAVDYGNDIVSEAIMASESDILTSWSTAIASDCEVLMAAAVQLDVPKLDAADPLLLKRAGQLNIWAEAVSAAERVDIALGGVRAILTALHINSGPEYRVMQLAPDATLDQFVGANAAAGPRGLSAWTTARSLAPLRLVSTVSEYKQAVARISSAQQEQQRRADDAEPRRRNRTRTWQPVPR
jgi:hypothetical protein